MFSLLVLTNSTVVVLTFYYSFIALASLLDRTPRIDYYAGGSFIAFMEVAPLSILLIAIFFYWKRRSIHHPILMAFVPGLVFGLLYAAARFFFS